MVGQALRPDCLVPARMRLELSGWFELPVTRAMP